MKLSRIHHVAIIVSDYEAAREFYVEKLGFRVKRENYRPERGDWKLDLRLSDTVELEIFAEKNPPARVSGPEACGLRIWRFGWKAWRKPCTSLPKRALCASQSA